MNQSLSISFRPKALKDLVGLSKLTAMLQGHYKTGRMPQAWLFAGDTGGGKTTIARILALSLQCQHQKEFGNPCESCLKDQTQFDIMEVNASEISGVDDIGKIAETSLYAPRPPSRYRVFILDECFPAGTLVDGFKNDRRIQIPIETLSKGDIILNALGRSRVKSTFRKEVHKVARIQTASRNIVSSTNHRFFTQEGWKAAGDLKVGDYLVRTEEAMRMVQRSHTLETIRVSQQSGSVLQSVVRGEVAEAWSSGGTEEIEVATGKNAFKIGDTAKETLCMVQGRSIGKDVIPVSCQTFLQYELREEMELPSARSSEAFERLLQIPQSIERSGSTETSKKKTDRDSEAESKVENQFVARQVLLELRKTTQEGSLELSEKEILQPVLRDDYANERPCYAEAYLRTDDVGKPDEEFSLRREDAFEFNGQAFQWNSWRQWYVHASSERITAGAGKVMGSRVRNLVVSEKIAGLPNELQIGFGESEIEDWNRGGWKRSQETGCYFEGSEEGQNVGFVRVDGIEILEQRDSRLDRYRDAEGKLYFYDLEVEGHPSYSVEGVLVHNCQRMSSAAQNLLLKPFEDSKRSVWIICTTDPQKILPTLRSRCIYYKLPGLRPEGVQELVTKAIQSTGKSPIEMKSSVLVDELQERGVWSARLVLMAVEKLLAGASPVVAAQVELVESTVDTLKICRSVVGGDWKTLHLLLKNAPAEEARGIVLAVMGYLRSVVLNPAPSRNATIAADAIEKLSGLLYMDDGARPMVLAAVLYQVCQRVSGGK